MRTHLITAAAAALLLFGCDSNRENIREAQSDLSETRQEAVRDVSTAQGEAVQNVNDAKKEAAEDIQDAQNELRDARREAAQDATQSGATTPNQIRVTHEQCARLAAKPGVTAEDRPLYDACTRLDPEKYRPR